MQQANREPIPRSVEPMLTTSSPRMTSVEEAAQTKQTAPFGGPQSHPPHSLSELRVGFSAGAMVRPSTRQL